MLNCHHEPIQFFVPKPPGSEKWEILIDTNDPALEADSRFTEPGAAIELVPLSLVVCREPTAPTVSQFADSGTPVKRYIRRFPVGAESLATESIFECGRRPERRWKWCSRAGTRFLSKRKISGYFSGVAPHARAGSRYKYVLDGSEACPDPASRSQPEGPHGSSAVVDASSFRWTDQNWRGVALPHQVIYEMHIGTFTKQGTWSSALAELPHLAETGVTVLELMPVAEFPGRFGWGYDGVQWFAPAHIYGPPDDFRRFVDRAHSLGMGVILDVVYNHLGPDGNYLAKFAPQYFCEKTTDWGPAINFDGDDCGPVREFCIANACYWIDEFHLDGLRLDATQDIHDSSEDHILRAMAREARKRAAPRDLIFVAENEPQEVKLVKAAERGGYGLDGLWNDDFHHSIMVALTGRNEAYYSDYLGTPQEFISSMKYGYLYQGQRYKWQKAAQRHAGPGHQSGGFRHVYPESRSNSQFRVWQALPGSHVAGQAARRYRADAACAWHADAVSRPGIRGVQPVLLFRRSQPGAQSANSPGARGVSGAIPQPGDSRNADTLRRSRRSRYF